MNLMNTQAKAFWEAYLSGLPLESRPVAPQVDVNFAGDREITDDLIRLYLDGKKSAGSSLVRDFEVTGDPLPRVSRYWIVLGSDENPQCILRTARVEICLFKDVSEEVARAEGEGDLSLAYWKETHRKFFSPFLAGWGVEDLEMAEVVTEYFDLVYRR